MDTNRIIADIDTEIPREEIGSVHFSAQIICPPTFCREWFLLSRR
jgi:hypothetical protein